MAKDNNSKGGETLRQTSPGLWIKVLGYKSQMICRLQAFRKLRYYVYLKVSTFFVSADISIAMALKKNVIDFRSSRFVVLPRQVIIGRPRHLMRTLLQII
jgi:hypothetical protein